jgi:hypothetical protein
MLRGGGPEKTLQLPWNARLRICCILARPFYEIAQEFPKPYFVQRTADGLAWSIGTP